MLCQKLHLKSFRRLFRPDSIFFLRLYPQRVVSQPSISSCCLIFVSIRPRYLQSVLQHTYRQPNIHSARMIQTTNYTTQEFQLVFKITTFKQTTWRHLWELIIIFGFLLSSCKNADQKVQTVNKTMWTKKSRQVKYSNKKMFFSDCHLSPELRLEISDSRISVNSLSNCHK